MKKDFEICFDMQAIVVYICGVLEMIEETG